MAAQRRSNPFLQYRLQGITPTNTEIGRGSYAVVEELYFLGLSCVGKSIHRELYENSPPHAQAQMLERFVEECELLSQIRHPHIVQFLGVHFKEAAEGQGGVSLPVIVMERLHCTLTSNIDRHGRLPEEISHSILREVATGLAYLHARPVVHRDLSANNILLATNMSAKIADLGVAKILDLSPARRVQMTTCPGTPSYMPPEALASGRAVYTTKIDIFSYGNLMTHVLSGEWPIPTQAFQFDPDNPNADPIPITEAERRKEYLCVIGNDHALMGLIRQCLSNNPAARPEASDILTHLEERAPQHPLFFTDRVEAFQRITEKIAENHKQVRQHEQEAEELLRAVNSLQALGNEIFLEKEQQIEHAQQQIDQLVLSHQAELKAMQIGMSELREECEDLRVSLRDKKEEVEAAEALARARGREATMTEAQLRKELKLAEAGSKEQVQKKNRQMEQMQWMTDQIVLSHQVVLGGLQVHLNELSGECDAMKKTLRTKEDEVKAAETLVKAREREATVKEEELSALRQELALKEEILEKKEGELWTLEQRLGLKNQQLSLKEDELSTKNQQLELKSKWLVRKQNELSSKDSKLAAKDKKLASRDLQLAAKDREIARIKHKVASVRLELTAKTRELEATKNDLTTVKANLDSQKKSVAIRDNQLVAKEAEVANKKEELAAARQTLLLREREVEVVKSEVTALKGERDAQKEAIAARDNQLKAKRQELTHKEGILVSKEFTISQLRSHSTMTKLLRKLKWKRCADMPGAMAWPKVIRINNDIYIGGGYSDEDKLLYAIFRYNSVRDTWSIFADCPKCCFGLIELNGKLVLVGGLKDLEPTSDICALEKSGEWVQFLPPLPTARFAPTVFRYKYFLVACGGLTSPVGKVRSCTTTVEVFDIVASQWYNADPLPIALGGMSFTIISDTCYFIGGDNAQGGTDFALSASLLPLVQRATDPHLDSDTPFRTSVVWKELPKCPCEGSTAAALGGFLLAIGGVLSNGNNSASVYVYLVDAWVRMPNADVPQPRYMASATQLANGDLIMIGGCGVDNNDEQNGISDSVGDDAEEDDTQPCSSVFVASIEV